jgi:hypothetical protein
MSFLHIIKFKSIISLVNMVFKSINKLPFMFKVIVLDQEAVISFDISLRLVVVKQHEMDK